MNFVYAYCVKILTNKVMCLKLSAGFWVLLLLFSLLKPEDSWTGHDLIGQYKYHYDTVMGRSYSRHFVRCRTIQFLPGITEIRYLCSQNWPHRRGLAGSSWQTDIRLFSDILLHSPKRWCLQLLLSSISPFFVHFVTNNKHALNSIYSLILSRSLADNTCKKHTLVMSVAWWL